MDNSVEKEKYKKLVEEMSPPSDVVTHCVRAFLVGGSICCFSEIMKDMLLYVGVLERDAFSVVTIILVFITSVLTALGLFEIIGNFAGSGTSVPITGFANSIVATAVEFRREGLVYGVGAKMFSFAGPVIVYGISTSFVVGIIYYLSKIIFGS